MNRSGALVSDWYFSIKTKQSHMVAFCFFESNRGTAGPGSNKLMPDFDGALLPFEGAYGARMLDSLRKVTA